ncbi:MAG TPA: hypothetical protein VMR75_04195, partial [Candidatus Saccharimonadales bacterium]|nr:hypothetical protein [Candidatus Saccharimonadales bacterium]
SNSSQAARKSPVVWGALSVKMVKLEELTNVGVPHILFRTEGGSMTKRAGLWYLFPLLVAIIMIALVFVVSEDDFACMWVAAGLLAWIQLFAAERKRGMDWANPLQLVYYVYMPLLLAGPLGLLVVAARLAPRIEEGESCHPKPIRR